MLVHDFIQVVLSDVVAYFVHSCDNILRRNVPRAIRVKLIENSLQFVIVHEFLHVERCHEEL